MKFLRSTLQSTENVDGRIKTPFRKSIGALLPSKFHSVIWVIALAVLTSLTLKDFLPLLNDYQNNNEAVNVKLVVGKYEFKVPRVVVSVPVYKPEDDDVWNLAVNMLDPNGTENGSESFLVAVRALRRELMIDILHNLTCTSITDLNASGLNPWQASSVLEFFYSVADLDGMGFLEPEFIIDPDHLLKNKTVVEHLHHLLLDYFCGKKLRFSQLEVAHEFDDGTTTNRTCHSLISDESIPILVEFAAGFEVALPNEEEPKMRKYRFEFLENGDAISWNPKTGDAWKRPIKFYPDSSVQYGDLISPISVPYIHQALMKSCGLNVTMQYGLEMRAKETRKSVDCQNESVEMCYSKCTKFEIMEGCACVPFSTHRGLNYPDALPFCNSELYSNCTSFSRSSATERCLEKCSHACEYSSYQWVISHDVLENCANQSGSTLNLMLIPMFNAFTEFSWVYKSTYEQFISSIGGIINLYLGFSGVTIFSAVILVIDWFREWRKLRKSGQQVESIGLSEIRQQKYEERLAYLERELAKLKV